MKFSKGVFVNTNRVENGTRELKSKEVFKKLGPLSDDILFRNDNMKYSDRPNKQFCIGKFESVDELCFAQFLSYYAQNVSSKQQHDVSCDYQPVFLEYNERILLNFKSNSLERFPLMNTKDLFPLQIEPAAVTFHEFKFSEDKENCYQHLLMLYSRWRKESDLMEPNYF